MFRHAEFRQRLGGTVAPGEVRLVRAQQAAEVDFHVSGEHELLQVDTHWPAHSHPVHELLWSEQGVLSVQAADRSWVLPPRSALWIPAGVRHSAVLSAQTVFRAVYFSPGYAAPLADQVTVAMITPLLDHLLEYVTSLHLDDAGRERAILVLADVLKPASARTEVWLPTDERCTEMAQQIIATPGDDHSLDLWAERLGVSSRTITRIFQSETGRGFRSWLVHIRVQRASALLHSGAHVQDIAGEVGFRTASAFAQTFRRVTGMSPSEFRSLTRNPSDRGDEMSLLQQSQSQTSD